MFGYDDACRHMGFQPGDGAPTSWTSQVARTCVTKSSEFLPFDLIYDLPLSGTLGFQPLLPHDEDFCWPGGSPC